MKSSINTGISRELGYDDVTQLVSCDPSVEAGIYIEACTRFGNVTHLQTKSCFLRVGCLLPYITGADVFNIP